MIMRIARFIRRGTDNSEDNVVIMSLMPAGKNLIKQDIIYEIREVLGQFVIVPVGKTHMDRKKWGQDLQLVMDTDLPLLTKDEMDSYRSLIINARDYAGKQTNE